MMEQEGQPIQPEGEFPQALPPHRIAELVGNGPIRDYRTIPREPVIAQNTRHGDEPVYCVPMNKCMVIMSVVFTGMILITLLVLLATESIMSLIDMNPQSSESPKFY